MKSKNKLFVLLITILLISCGSDSSTATNVDDSNMDIGYELETVTINNSTQINYAPIFFAEEEGYFKEFGIELEILTFNRVTESIPLLVSGDVDVYAGSNSTGLINVLMQEPNVKVVADRGKIIKDGCTFQAILVRKDLYDSGEIVEPADLAGKTIYASETGSRGFNLYSYLTAAGLTFEDVELTNIPSSSLFDAVKNKTVDLIVIPELNLTRLLEEGEVVIFSRAEDVISPNQVSVLAFGPRLISEDPDLGVRFLAAYLKGVRKYNEGKTEDNLELLAKRTGDEIDLLRNACWVPIREDGWIDFAEVDPFQQFSITMGQLDSPITEDQFWDPSFLEAATALLSSNE